MRRIPNHSADISLESSWFNKQSSSVYRDDHTSSSDNSLYCLDQLERLHRYHTNSLWPLIHFGLLLFYYWQFFSNYFLSLDDSVFLFHARSNNTSCSFRIQNSLTPSIFSAIILAHSTEVRWNSSPSYRKLVHKSKSRP